MSRSGPHSSAFPFITFTTATASPLVLSSCSSSPVAATAVVSSASEWVPQQPVATPLTFLAPPSPTGSSSSLFQHGPSASPLAYPVLDPLERRRGSELASAAGLDQAAPAVGVTDVGVAAWLTPTDTLQAANDETGGVGAGMMEDFELFAQGNEGPADESEDTFSSYAFSPLESTRALGRSLSSYTQYPPRESEPDTSPFNFDLDYDSSFSPSATPLFADEPAYATLFPPVLEMTEAAAGGDLAALEKVRRHFVAINLRTAKASQEGYSMLAPAPAVSPFTQARTHYNTSLQSVNAPPLTVSPQDVSPTLVDEDLPAAYPSLFAPSTLSYRASSQVVGGAKGHARKKSAPGLGGGHPFSKPGNAHLWLDEYDVPVLDEVLQAEQQQLQAEQEEIDEMPELLHSKHGRLSRASDSDDDDFDDEDDADYAAVSEREIPAAAHSRSQAKRIKRSHSPAESSALSSPLSSVSSPPMSSYVTTSPHKRSANLVGAGKKKKQRRRSNLQPNKLRRRPATTSSSNQGLDHKPVNKLSCDQLLSPDESGGEILDSGERVCGVVFRRINDLARHKETIHGMSLVSFWFLHLKLTHVMTRGRLSGFIHAQSCARLALQWVWRGLFSQGCTYSSQAYPTMWHR